MYKFENYFLDNVGHYSEKVTREGQAEFYAMYSVEEQALLVKLDALMSCWRKTWLEFSRNESCSESERYKQFIPDGFFPNYLRQPKKILFIGKEAYDLNGSNYIEDSYYAYREGRRHAFRSRLMWTAYGLLNNLPWNLIPDNVYCNQQIFNDASFAFMNLSKLNNGRANTKDGEANERSADWDLIETSLEMSTTGDCNFIREEINLLAPDVIIMMNLGRKSLCKMFERESVKVIHEASDICKYEIRLSEGHFIPLFDTWHFSRSNFERVVYGPLRDAWAERVIRGTPIFR